MVSLSLVNHLYTMGSLRTLDSGPGYRVKNRLFDATLTAVTGVTIDGQAFDPATSSISVGDVVRTLASVTPDDPLPFPLRAEFEVRLTGPPLAEGPHTIASTFVCEPFGPLGYEAVDYVVRPPNDRPHIPRSADDWSPAAVKERQDFVQDVTGVRLEHVASTSYDPRLAQGNIEHLTGSVEIPLGIAGPLRVNGEQAQGEFLIPLATTEGTLVASYNRGIKVLNAAGGVTCTVQDDSMQRAPVFIFDSARQALPRPPVRVLPVRLHDRRRGRAEHGRQGDVRGHVVDHLATSGDPALLPRVELRHGQEIVPGQRDADPRQAGDRRSGDPPPGPRRDHEGRARDAGASRRRGQRGCLPLRCRVVGGRPPQRGRRGRSLPRHHPALPDRGHLRRRNRAADPGRVPGHAGLRRTRQGRQVRRDRGRHRPRRRALAGLGDLRPRLGQLPERYGRNR